jgi:hypothetical protein
LKLQKIQNEPAKDNKNKKQMQQIMEMMMLLLANARLNTITYRTKRKW